MEVNFASFPFFGDFDEDGGDEAQERGFAGEQPHDAGPSFDLRVERFAHIRGAQPLPCGLREAEDGEPFGKVGLSPSGKLRGFACVFGNEGGKLLLYMGAVFGVEDAADVLRDLLLEIPGGDVSPGVLLEVELSIAARGWSSW